jgi:hypothetical protein
MPKNKGIGFSELVPSQTESTLKSVIITEDSVTLRENTTIQWQIATITGRKLQ